MLLQQLHGERNTVIRGKKKRELILLFLSKKKIKIVSLQFSLIIFFYHRRSDNVIMYFKLSRASRVPVIIVHINYITVIKNMKTRYNLCDYEKLIGGRTTFHEHFYRHAGRTGSNRFSSAVRSNTVRVSF